MSKNQACPSIVFKLNEGIYAIGSENVQAIMKVPNTTPMPHAQHGMVGVFLFRGGPTGLFDLRQLLGYQQLEEELQAFSDMLDQRKEDHIRWVEELERSIRQKEKFQLTTDPHQCAFGKWYDHFESKNNSVMFHLRKIKEPHDNLHRAAHEVEQCKQECDTCERDECLKSILKRTKEQYMPVILRLLDETKAIYAESMRQMAIVVGETKPIAFSVDEVLSVEHLIDLP